VPLYIRSSLPDDLELLASDIVDAVLEVRQVLGRGLLERGYTDALAFELADRGHAVEREVVMSFEYKGRTVERAYRIDILVDRRAVIECKIVDELRREHYAQVATYLRMSGNRLGFLVNFDAVPIGSGIKRIVR